LDVDDMTDAAVFALENKLSDHLYNIGTGKDLTIKEFAELIQKIVDHSGEILWDDSKPDGTPRKLMNVDKMRKQGLEAKIKLEEGIRETYHWFLKNNENYKQVKL
jgi:GDP-L-fucose synthase